MKKRIFVVLTAALMSSIIILCLSSTLIYYNFYKIQSENGIKALANLFVNTGFNPDNLSGDLIKNIPYEVRITLIDSEGNVDFDTRKNLKFENHLDREEVKEAFASGTGEATRKSDTLGKDAYYYAIKYKGYVIRFSREFNNISSVFISVVPYVVVIAFALIVMSTVIASKLSESLIKPVNSLVESLNVLKRNEKSVDVPEIEYDELRPIARTIKDLSYELWGYIASLKEEKETISLITENMVEGMILLDNYLNILSVNKSAINILNHEFVLDKTKNILQLTRNSEIISAIETVKSNKSPSASVTITTSNQKHYKVFVNHAKSNNFVCGIIVLIVDVTESIKVEEIRRDFAANVSHELKTPLTTIKGFGEMLSAGIITDRSDISRYGSTICREAERLILLINDIIRLSEIEEAGSVKEKTPVDLLECVEEAENVLQKIAAEKGVSIEIDGESAVVNGNKSYLNELVLNLADNAIKYNNADGHVWISVKNFDSKAVLVVKDDGIGISKEHQERIFERFYRVDKSRSKQTGGTGLGLSIVKHIVNFHNGTISLKSEEGMGTEITVSLPK
ncbi:MAG TPA: ATP-binding protein [Oscillospiraceae bacterium]|nr:ATP-binding protein [Oscillospiraceae bacterium]